MNQRARLLCSVLLLATACGKSPSGGTSTVSQPVTAAVPSVDPTCSPASLHLWSGLHFTGDELCLFGEGTANLAGFPMASGGGSWVGHVQGIEVGIAAIFLNGDYDANESFSTPYGPGFVDDLATDLPPNVSSVTLTSGTCSPTIGECGFLVDDGGHSLACGPLGGACPGTRVCVAHNCCQPDNSQVCANRECGTNVNGCGQAISCGFLGLCLQSGTQCTPEGHCCKTTASACGSFTCGTADDGCGHALSCGVCDFGSTCSNHVCITKACTRKCTPPLYINPDTCTCGKLINQ